MTRKSVARKSVTVATTAKRGQPTRRVVPIWRSRWAALVLAVAMIGGAAGYGGWLWQQGWVAVQTAKAEALIVKAGSDIGLNVQEILVAGRVETDLKTLKKALKLKRGEPILGFDVNAARKRIEALAWVRTAIVRRSLPDTVIVGLEERQPMALWQRKGRFSLIDHEGVVIVHRDINRFRDLVVVVGSGAPKKASGLLEILETRPEMMARVKAAVWIGGRRWDVRLNDGIDVRLPEKNPINAWARLAAYQKKHKVLGKNIRVLDLRQPGRLIVKRKRNSITRVKAKKS